ncbi:MAG: hypothetical protein KF816_11480 [Melioribacteraceae bacterium]|nr:hypothetical protein [Melioribacteraceae bacterium]
MVKDSDLKLDKFYIALVTDNELGELCGQIIKVKFTGIVFRNAKYIKQEVEVDNHLEIANESGKRKKIESKFSSYPDSVFYLSQLKIYREASANE